MVFVPILCNIEVYTRERERERKRMREKERKSGEFKAYTWSHNHAD